MTQLDELTIDIKTKGGAQTRSEIAAIDKQLDDMDKKGKKRNEIEEKQYQLLKKHRKELFEDTRQQQRETDKLSDSFKNLATNVVGAATAWATFSGIKNGLIDVNRLNVGLANLAGQTGISAQKYRELGAAIASSTGLSPDVANTLLSGYAAQRKAVNLPVTDAGAAAYVQTLRNTLKSFPKGQGPAGILGIPGVNDALPFLQLPEDQYQKGLGFGKSVSGNQADYDAAVKNQDAAAKALLEAQKIATQENTEFSGVVQLFNQAVQTFAGAFTNHPVAAGIAEGAGALGIALGARKFLGGLAGGALFRGAVSVLPKWLLGIAAVGGAGYLAYEFSKNPSDAGAPSTPAPPAPSGSSPLGIRSNNPGNLMPGGKESIFSTPGAGISALSSQLQRYGKRGWNTLGSILEHYAPPGSNNTQAYIAAVSRDTGFSPTQSLNLSDPSVLQKLIPAIIKHENGYNPYSASLINQSIAGAGFSGSGKTVNVKIDDVNVHTAATDAAGIAGAVGAELKNQIRMAMSNFDDGINA